MTELVVSATATDAHGQVATASVTVDVEEPQPGARFAWFRPPATETGKG